MMLASAGQSRAENEVVYRDMCEKMLALGPHEPHQKRIRLCETLAYVNGRFQRRFYAWKYGVKKGEPFIETFQIGYQNEGENPYVRNLVWLGCAGYQVAFPGEKCRSYYMGAPGTKYEAWEYRRWSGKFNPSMYLFWDDEKLKSCDPRLKYFVPNDRGNIMFELDTFRRHPQSESLFKLGLGKLALQERMYRLSPESAKQVIKFIGKNLEDVRKNQNLNVILGCIAKNITAEKFMKDHKCRMIERDDYLSAQGARLNEYVDYLALAKKMGYDMKDKKHVFPRHFKETYKALLEESDKRKNKEVSDKILMRTEAYSRSEGVINGFMFRFPTSFWDFREQAETLGNCLISNEYYKRYAEGKTVIVFVLDSDGKRVATADVTGGRINQFTGNQRHKDWRPSEKISESMDAWMANMLLPNMKGGSLCQRG